MARVRRKLRRNLSCRDGEAGFFLKTYIIRCGHDVTQRLSLGSDTVLHGARSIYECSSQKRVHLHSKVK